MFVVDVDERDVHLTLAHSANKGLLKCTCCCLLHSQANKLPRLAQANKAGATPTLDQNLLSFFTDLWH
jgi:hypothetical protein